MFQRINGILTRMNTLLGDAIELVRESTDLVGEARAALKEARQVINLAGHEVQSSRERRRAEAMREHNNPGVAVPAPRH